MLHEPSERLNLKIDLFTVSDAIFLEGGGGGGEKTAKIAVYVWEKIKFGAQ